MPEDDWESADHSRGGYQWLEQEDRFCFVTRESSLSFKQHPGILGVFHCAQLLPSTFIFSPELGIKSLYANTHYWLPSGRVDTKKWNCLAFMMIFNREASSVKIFSSHLNFLYPPENFNTSVTSSASLSFFQPPPSHFLYTSPALWQDLLGAMKRYCHLPPRGYLHSARKDQPWWTHRGNAPKQKGKFVNWFLHCE